LSLKHTFRATHAVPSPLGPAGRAALAELAKPFVLQLDPRTETEVGRCTRSYAIDRRADSDRPGRLAARPQDDGFVVQVTASFRDVEGYVWEVSQTGGGRDRLAMAAGLLAQTSTHYERFAELRMSEVHAPSFQSSYAPLSREAGVPPTMADLVLRKSEGDYKQVPWQLDFRAAFVSPEKGRPMFDAFIAHMAQQIRELKKVREDWDRLVLLGVEEEVQTVRSVLDVSAKLARATNRQASRQASS
jgi:hypothetical protein